MKEDSGWFQRFIEQTIEEKMCLQIHRRAAYYEGRT